MGRKKFHKLRYLWKTRGGDGICPPHRPPPSMRNRVNKFILVCVNNNIFWQIKFIISTKLLRGCLSNVFQTSISTDFCFIAKKIMKCLLCSSSFDNDEELIEHYITYRKIEPNSRFFQKLFQSNKTCSVFCKCLRWDDFLTTSDFKMKRDFLKHYNEVYNDLFEVSLLMLKKLLIYWSLR